MLRSSARTSSPDSEVNRAYVERWDLAVETMGRGYASLDTGAPDSMLDATEYVRILEKRQVFNITGPNEIAFRRGFIDAGQNGSSARSASRIMAAFCAEPFGNSEAPGLRTVPATLRSARFGLVLTLQRFIVRTAID